VHLLVSTRLSQTKASGTVVDIMDIHKDMMHMDMLLLLLPPPLPLPKTLACIMEDILDMETTSNQELTNSNRELTNSNPEHTNSNPELTNSNSR
jgi:hypothetical protein